MNVELKDIRSEEIREMGKKSTSGIDRSKGGNVRGVSQKEIDKKRGELGHQDYGAVTTEIIQAQYAQVGIDLTRDEATDIRKTEYHYTDYSGEHMREARLKYERGEPLTISEKNYLEDYRICEEYCKVAPRFKPSGTETEIYRGINRANTPESQRYYDRLLTLRPGDSWNNDNRPTSYTTNIGTAGTFAKRGNIIVHTPVNKLKNSISIRALSQQTREDEVLVADYKWKIARISDERSKPDGFYHIYMK